MNAHRFHRHLLAAALLGALVPGAASATVYTVGGDIACDFHDLQSALDAAATNSGPVTIRFARNLHHAGGTFVAKGVDVRIVGGYADCRRERALGATRIGRDGAPVRVLREDSQSVSVRAVFADGGPVQVETVTAMAGASAPKS
jgi:hypothetical protein